MFYAQVHSNDTSSITVTSAQSGCQRTVFTYGALAVSGCCDILSVVASEKRSKADARAGSDCKLLYQRNIFLVFSRIYFLFVASVI